MSKKKDVVTMIIMFMRVGLNKDDSKDGARLDG